MTQSIAHLECKDFNSENLMALAIKIQNLEQQRIAKDVHDSLGCLLSTAYLLTDTLEVSDKQRLEEVKSLIKEAQEELEKLLISSCNYRMIADVPVGVFLSGGYDSTTVTSILAQHHGSKIKTFN